MALTRAQYLAGNANDGVVLLDEPQGVRPGGIGITIDPDGIIWVNGKDPRLVTLIKTNNDNAYNAYIWPDDIPGGPVDTFLSVDATGTLNWQTVLPPGTNMVFFNPVAPVGWTQLTSPVLNDAAIRLVAGAGGGTGGTENFSSVFSNRTIPLPIHNHSITDPGHQHPYTDPGHNHPLTDPTHNHGISDPGHSHGINDPTHNHGINDPGHNHPVSDPGHSHGVSDPGHSHSIRYNRNPVGTNNDQSSDLRGFGNSSNTVSSVTGIGINSSGTGISISSRTTGISIRDAGTGISVRSGTTGVSTQNRGTGIVINNNTTGLTIDGNTTGITVNDAGTGSQITFAVKYANMIVCTKD